MPSGKRTTTTKSDYTKLVDLQEFDGSWLLTKKLAAILGKPEQDLRVKTVVKVCILLRSSHQKDLLLPF